VLSYLELAILPVQAQSKGECTMALPDTLTAWCLWLFFLWYGLAAFIPALNTDTFRKVGAVLALGFVLFSLLGM
jgi:hypothetical protein